MKYASFGTINFEISSYQKHQEEIEYIYAKHETIWAPSSIQFMGTELENINLSIRLHRSFCNPIVIYQQLKNIAKLGQANKLIIATKLLGSFTINKISSSTKQLDVWGNPVLIDCDIEFCQYIEKKLQTRKIKINRTAPAVKFKNTNYPKTPAVKNNPSYSLKKVTNAEGFTNYIIVRKEKGLEYTQ